MNTIAAETAPDSPERLLVHVVTYDRLPLLRRCCESIAAALPNDASVLVHFNGAQPEAEAWLRDFGDDRFMARTSPRRVPAARLRNEPLESRHWSVVYFLDDDVTVPKHLFRSVLERLNTDRTLGFLGGPQLTPPGSSQWQRVQGAVLGSPWTAPGVFARYTAVTDDLRPADERSLTLCNLAVRCSSLREGLLLPDTVRSNEENIWMAEAQSTGVKLAYQGDAYVFHERRASLGAFARQIYGYGFGRAEHLLCRGRIPMIFCVPMLGVWTAAVLLATPAFWRASIPLASLYAALVTLAFLTTRRRESLPFRAFPVFFLAALLLHGTYGCGFTAGLIRGCWARRGRAEAATTPVLEIKLS